MSGAEAAGTIAALREQLETPDLAILLGLMSDQDIDRLARILTDMPKHDVLHRLETAVGRDTFRLSGRALIPGIVNDVSWLGSPTIGSSKSYREVLQAVARRHDIKDDGTARPSAIERELQSQYPGRLRPDPQTFAERPSTTRLGTMAARIPLAGKVAATAFPYARIATAVVLEIAALRRIALTRDLAESLGVV